MENIHAILSKYWGFQHFKPMQEEIINSVLEGKDTLALLPTGGGKSLCFQVPALAKEGICLVVSPLIALMKDQVENLKGRDIPAVAIVSGMHHKEIDIALDNCIYGKTKFLYMSPERLTSELVCERIKKMNINLLAVDEAHCISQWGYDFRPPYLEIAQIKPLLTDVPIIALTASATPEVVTDIQEKLKFRQKNIKQNSFERKNLAYMVLSEENKGERMMKIINKVKGTGIIYVRNRRKTRETALLLQKQGILADYYHAGLNSKERDKRQIAWLKGSSRIIVATNAFGMGIDKPDVRFVIHLDLPDSPEAYFQEAGRGGRDGQKSFSVILCSDSDKRELQQRVEMNFPDIKTIKNTYQGLANYYQLAVGAGKDQSFDFNISQFCEQYQFKPTEVHNSLKFLEKEGYIAVTDALHLPSRLHFKVNKNELYNFQIAHKRFDPFIKLLLRSYSGFFDDFVRINEVELGKRSNMLIKDVKEYLEKLDKFGIVSYLPQTEVPQIVFTEERLAQSNLRISAKHYEERKKAALKRMHAVLRYVGSEHLCRSRSLLSYFGEQDTQDCEICDVCLFNQKKIKDKEFAGIFERIESLIREKPRTLPELTDSIKKDEDEILHVVQWFIDNGKLKYNQEQQLELH